jgi:hypothetical protein
LYTAAGGGAGAALVEATAAAASCSPTEIAVLSAVRTADATAADMGATRGEFEQQCFQQTTLGQLIANQLLPLLLRIGLTS